MARVHFVDLASFQLVPSTLCTYTVRFVDVTNENRVASTLCPLPSTPSMPPLTLREEGA